MGPELDHLVVGCLDLEAGGREMERRLGVAPQGGGAHEGAGSRNLLWGLEDARGGERPPVYLELIAPDPAQSVETPLPFGLSRPEVRALVASGPRLLTWMARCTHVDDWAARSPAALGPVGSMRRGDLAWRLTRAPGPIAPHFGALPGLIEWPHGAATPSETLAGSGLALVVFERRPNPETAKALRALGLDEVLPEAPPEAAPAAGGEGAAIRAVIEGPGGRVTLD